MSSVIKFPKAREGSKWFDIKNETAESADVYIYDVVGDPWVGMDAASIVKQLNALQSKKINLRINSPGGSVFDGMAIYNALAHHSAEVTTYIDGIAASIASVIALAGKRVLIAENAMMMIHDPSGLAFGKAEEIRKTADVLDQIKETIINTYVTRTGLTRDKVSKMMSDETWLTASEAVDLKFADEAIAGVKAAAVFDLKAFGYVKAPGQLEAADSSQASNDAIHSSSASAEHVKRTRNLALLEKLTINPPSK
jgi:ATP-dependent Clp protease protease subunit